MVDMKDAEYRDEFAVIMAREISEPAYYVASLCTTLVKLGRSHRRLQEADCNYGLTPRQQARERNIEEQIRQLCQPHGITPVFQGDPRGTTVKLVVPSGATNDFGRTGVCVPDS